MIYDHWTTWSHFGLCLTLYNVCIIYRLWIYYRISESTDYFNLTFTYYAEAACHTLTIDQDHLDPVSCTLNVAWTLYSATYSFDVYIYPEDSGIKERLDVRGFAGTVTSPIYMIAGFSTYVLPKCFAERTAGSFPRRLPFLPTEKVDCLLA